MPKLEAYSRDLPYSYALGIFPAMECLSARPQACQRLLVHSEAGDSEGVRKLIAAAQAHGVRIEQADRMLGRLSGKENCYAAMVFAKQQDALDAHKPHLVLHHPSDGGNAGTMLRTCLALGVRDVAIIRPAVDIYDPRVVRASMGALLHLNIAHYDDFAAYRAVYAAHAVYPLMLDGAKPLDEVARQVRTPYALVLGNEATGLPPEFAQAGQTVRIPQSERVDSLNVAVAAAIGLYAFRQAEGAFDGARVKEDI